MNLSHCRVSPQAFVTIFGMLVLRIARTRTGSFLPRAMGHFQRRANEVILLIREALLRGVSTRQMGRLVAVVTGEAVGAEMVSRLGRHLDRLVRMFHQARLKGEWAYLFLGVVSLRLRRLSRRKQVQMLCCLWGVPGRQAAGCWPSCAARAKANPPGRAF
jgi:transposase-like protein